MKVARGTIQLVQEQRFRVRTDDGRSLLLTVAPRARIEPGDLRRLMRDGRRVEVGYVGEPGLTSGVAVRVGLKL